MRGPWHIVKGKMLRWFEQERPLTRMQSEHLWDEVKRYELPPGSVTCLYCKQAKTTEALRENCPCSPMARSA